MPGLKNVTADLPRQLGLLDSLCIVIGVVVGGGIFLVPNLVARDLHSSAAILSVWVFGLVDESEKAALKRALYIWKRAVGPTQPIAIFKKAS